MTNKKSSKSSKRVKRRKLSKLLKSIQEVKKRIPTCKGGYAFKSKKSYDRKENNKILDKEINDWYNDLYIDICYYLHIDCVYDDIFII